MASPGSERHDLDVPVAPLADRRGGSSRAPILAAAVIGGIVLAAIGLARVFPTTPDGPIVALPSVAATTSVPAIESPRGDALAIPAAPRLRVGQLVEGVLDGSLNGALVYADAFLRSSCRPEDADDCGPLELAIDGLPLEIVTRNPDAEGVTALPEHGMLVLVVRGSRLEYLGSLVVNPTGSPTLRQLARSGIAEGQPGPWPTLVDVAGWLVLNPACVTSGGAAASSGATPCPERPPFLAEEEPLRGGILRSDAGEVVALSPALWGVDPLVDTVTAGPFLVARAGEDPTWEVFAKYDPSRSVRVVIP